MISSSVIAKQRRCLRHQLREALWKSWLNSYSHTPQNAFFTRAARFQEEAPQIIIESKPTTLETDDGPISIKPGLVVRKVDPGRIVGKGGRRQAVVSQRITRNSLEKPSYVVIFRDVDGKEKAEPVEVVSDVADGTMPEIITSPLMPTPEETIASIDALKPPTSPILVDKAEYKRLKDTLLTGYNTVQLRDYLVHCFARLKSFPTHISSPDSVDDDIESQRIGKWQAGQTPLEQRPKLKAEKKPSAHVKKRMAENILRLAWQVIVTSDQSKVGEIEITVQPWELKILFDMDMNGKPTFHSLLSSDILVQNSEIRPYRPDNVVRITARRQDAEDIARQLRRALFSVKRLELDLKIFSPLLGQHGWPSTLEELFHDDDLKFVSETANALINRADDNVLVVQAFSASAENDAQRLLLAHLKKPTPTSHNQLIDVAQTMTDDHKDRTNSSELIAIPCASDNNHLNRCHRHSNLVRMVKPVARRTRAAADQARETIATELKKDGSAAREKFAELIGQQLQAVVSYSEGSQDVQNHPGSYWGKSIRLRSQNWRAHLCKLLRSADEKQIVSNSGGQATSLIPVYEVPGAERLVSYFDSHQKALKKRARSGIRSHNTYENKRFSERIDSTLPNLVACFVPSPFTQAGAEVITRLPTIELRFRFLDASKDPNTDESGEDQPPKQESRNELRLYGVRAVLDQQFVSIPLPGEAVDVLFSRPTLMFADRHAIAANTDVALFIRQLREVFFSDGKVLSTTELPFLLPRWLVQGEKPSEDSAEEPDVPVQYLFDRFEQIQACNLELAYSLRQLGQLDPEDSTLLKRIPKEVHLELRQVEGSVVHGKETSLNVRLEQGSRINATEGSKPEANKEEGNTNSSEDVTSPKDELSDVSTDDTQTSTRSQVGPIEEPKPLLRTLAQTALDVAHLLTRANAGAIPVPYTKPARTEVRDTFGRVYPEPDKTFSRRNITKVDPSDEAERNRQAISDLFEFPFEADDDMAGLKKQATSSDKQSTPMDEQSTPMDEQSAPMVEQSMPFDEQSTLTDEDLPPATPPAKPRRNLFAED
jgi:hypothetical protein